ncbi:hypothetical protein PR048_011626 [Dryococelus australis]|uniref:Uncharacterized protein n=1 Tax=Dryococelus australis TaxID=614101 RepID=A0ABQ9HMR1_9NEOP|nr:hypothetical protein PR048_011626 [Dryococelus australis]
MKKCRNSGTADEKKSDKENPDVLVDVYDIPAMIQSHKGDGNGPVYTPESFAPAIRSTRKTGEPFHIYHLYYEDFHDIKALAGYIVPLNVTALQLSTVKVLKYDETLSVFYKNSYTENFKEATIVKKMKVGDASIQLMPVLYSRPGIASKKE